jgi:hypothetical protein
MTGVRLVPLTLREWSSETQAIPSRTLSHSRAWLEFVAETQNASPALARAELDGKPVGFFAGLVVKKWGFTILGSPFPGWTTPYMGFSLSRTVPGAMLMKALVAYALEDLGCHHLEVLDRRLTLEDGVGLGFEHTMLNGFEVDLTYSEDELFGRLSSACRRAIRKAQRSGVVVEEASDPTFADDYYRQLTEVFEGQGLVPTYPLERVRQLIRHVWPTGRLLLLRARASDGQCIATALFPAMGETMYFWGGASRRALRHLRPNEAIQWYAMTYWRRRAVGCYDMGGDGEYKKKYGGRPIAVPWFRKSRSPLIGHLRNAARFAHGSQQRISGLLRRCTGTTR